MRHARCDVGALENLVAAKVARPHTHKRMSADEVFRARVVAVHKSRWELSPGGPAVLAGGFTKDAADLPLVGDWVLAEDHQSLARILDVEPRRGACSRASDLGTPRTTPWSNNRSPPTSTSRC